MKARSQTEHEAINRREYPGTRQLCAWCDEPTGRCEQDDIYLDDGRGPLCPDCLHEWEDDPANSVLDRSHPSNTGGHAP